MKIFLRELLPFIIMCILIRGSLDYSISIAVNGKISLSFVGYALYFYTCYITLLVWKSFINKESNE